MEMIQIYIPGNLEKNNGSIAIIYELHHELVGQLMTSKVDINKELILKAEELKEVKIAEYLKTI